MSHATIRKRLLEFEETPTAELTLEEFNHVNLESECDPPCFTEGKRKAALLQQQVCYVATATGATCCYSTKFVTLLK